MNYSEIIKQAEAIAAKIKEAANEAKSGLHPDFNRELIKSYIIDLYKLCSTDPEVSGLSNATANIPSEVKKVIQESVEVNHDETPRISQENKVPEPVVREVKTVINPPEKTIAAEKSEEEISLNEKISKTKAPVMNYADKSKETAIKDLTKAISIGKKFEFINGLFAGDGNAYKSCIALLQNSSSYQEAFDHLEMVSRDNSDWEENESLSAEFYSLLRRRFQ